jgi:predicted enzyme related to lactoylglutathione lyase
MINDIKIVSIPVGDQDRALAFYTEKLGFAVTTDQAFGGGKRWIELEVPGASSKVVLFTPDGQEERIGTFSNIVFGTGDIQKTYEELSARGVEFAAPPSKQPWGTFVQFSDPDGNSFVLSSTD